MNNKNTLLGIAFFDGLTGNELQEITNMCKSVKFKRGDRVFSRGDGAKYFYIVRSGTVELTLPVNILLAEKEIVVDVKRPGDVFGWSALIEFSKMTLSAHCSEDCELIQMRGSDVLSFCAKKHHVGYTLMGNIAKVISNRMERIQDLFQKEIEINCDR